MLSPSPGRADRASPHPQSLSSPNLSPLAIVWNSKRHRDGVFVFAGSYGPCVGTRHCASHMDHTLASEWLLLPTVLPPSSPPLAFSSTTRWPGEWSELMTTWTPAPVLLLTFRHNSEWGGGEGSFWPMSVASRGPRVLGSPWLSSSVVPALPRLLPSLNSLQIQSSRFVDLSVGGSKPAPSSHHHCHLARPDLDSCISQFRCLPSPDSLLFLFSTHQLEGCAGRMTALPF